MRVYIRFFVFYLLFWLTYFLLQRAIFLTGNFSILQGIPAKEILLSFIYGFLMDISSACYICVIPLIFVLFCFLIKKSFPNRLILWYTIIFLIFCSFIGVADISLYEAWGTKINGKALNYLAYPKEAFAAVSSVPFFKIILLFLLQLSLSIYAYFKWMNFEIKHKEIYWWAKCLFITIGLILVFGGIRGGWQAIPLNRNWVYYSRNPVLNNAALNSFWNIADVISQPSLKVNPYTYFESEKSELIVKNLHKVSKDTTIRIVNQGNPNIVLIILESFSAGNIKSFGGDSISPGLDKISKESLCLTNAYATGFRTEQGFVALFNSFPAQPKESIMRHFGKFEQLPNLINQLNSIGYTSYYYYSGDIDFANMKAYLLSSGFNKIFSRLDFKNPKHETRWGVYDEELFNFHLQKASKDKKPFCSVIMTSTSHEPFDASVIEYYKGGEEIDRYKNTIRYTDNCVLNYIETAKKQEWYKNTLFIITADHAHKYPGNWAISDPLRYKIPLLFYGGALKTEFKGKVIDKPVSQIDLSASILAQLGLPAEEFTMSKNIFNPYSPSFAFYTFNNGFGIITSNQQLVFDNDLNQVIYSSEKTNSKSDSLNLVNGKALLQSMMEKYIHLNN